MVTEDPDQTSLLVRLSKAEKNEFKDCAAMMGMSVNSFMLSAARTYKQALTPAGSASPAALLNHARASYTTSLANSIGTASSGNPYSDVISEAIDKLSGE